MYDNILYEYELSDDFIDSLENELRIKSTDVYKSDDTCLLVALPRSDEENKKVYQNRACIKDKLPIPFFKNGKASTFSGLPQGFNVYILEVHAGLYRKTKYDLIPNTIMPSKWQNGYSRGVAISKQKSTVIYWSAIW
ncbi:MAG: hypothetical protein EOP48_34065 [Sphingobacteriales bacterium]|nr:MAG: hypothetical protein EOP48_34065 [Sphingobacteriales bacterium]